MLYRALGIIIVAIKKSRVDMMVNPTFKSTIQAGDTLVAPGEDLKLRTLEEMALSKKACIHKQADPVKFYQY